MPSPVTFPLRWLYVDFNSYFASVEQQVRPELRGRPTIVVPVMTDATCAIAASYEAKAFGIKTGTPVYEAKRMCKDLALVLANHEHYLDYHERFKAEIDRHIPITLTASIDEVACRMMQNEAARAVEIAQQIKQGLAANVGEYVRCSIGIAPSKYLAKVATDLQKPDGLTVLRHEDLHRLETLKLRDLPGVGPNMEIRLHKAGIRTMRELMALDAKHLRKIWGSMWGEKMWYYLRGFDLPDQETSRSTVGHSHVLGPELRDPAKARHVMRRLTQKAASRLRRIGYHAGAMSIGVRVENGPRLEAGMRFFRAQDNVTLLHAVEMLWDEVMRQGRPTRLKKVSVALHALEQVGDMQAELFGALPEQELRDRAKGEQLSRAMDALNLRFGRDTVSLGILPEEGRSFSGTKIAFTRIPDKEEFLE